jgi:hypothetical protein
MFQLNHFDPVAFCDVLVSRARPFSVHVIARYLLARLANRGLPEALLHHATLL